MSEGRATPYYLGTNILAIPVQEPVCTMCHPLLCVLQRAQMELGRLTITSWPSRSSRWNAGGSRGRMEALMEEASHPCRRFPPEVHMTVVQVENKKRNAGVGNRRADGPFPSRRDGAACS
jgi:hypothetical protein